MWLSYTWLSTVWHLQFWPDSSIMKLQSWSKSTLSPQGNLSHPHYYRLFPSLLPNYFCLLFEPLGPRKKGWLHVTSPEITHSQEILMQSQKLSLEGSRNNGVERYLKTYHSAFFVVYFVLHLQIAETWIALSHLKAFQTELKYFSNACQLVLPQTNKSKKWLAQLELLPRSFLKK